MVFFSKPCTPAITLSNFLFEPFHLNVMLVIDPYCTNSDSRGKKIEKLQLFPLCQDLVCGTKCQGRLTMISLLLTLEICVSKKADIFCCLLA